MKRSLLKIPKDHVLVPYREREKYPELREDECYALGRGLDLRLIGWVVPAVSLTEQSNAA